MEITTTDMEYNSQRPKMVIPEYGRNIQKMIDYAMTLEDRDERNKCAGAIIKVMGELFPHLRDIEDYKHKLWDHLIIISNFQIDVDSPYPKPSIEVLTERPERMEYPQGKIKYGHYGKHIQDMIKKCVATEAGENRDAFTLAIANLMKRSHLTWNRDSVRDSVITNHLLELSNGELKLAEGQELIATSNIVPKNPPRNNNPKRKQHSNKYKQKKKY